MLQAEKFAEYEFESLEKTLENDLTSFGKGLTVLETVSTPYSLTSALTCFCPYSCTQGAVIVIF